MMKISLQIAFPLFVFLCGCVRTTPPPPFGAVPSERQLQWHRMKYYAFIHFGPNTFTDKEWGFGDEPESVFNPTQLDCRQWARVAKEGGMEGIIITAKHHDGFCLWPSKYTEHSVKNSPWKNGKGDVLSELQQACDEYGLKLGIYLSPWDRNHPAYGTPAYLDYYRNQLRELLTNYGEVFEVWFDGANGGDGYYGGARETRRIDNTSYYDWEHTRSVVRKLQPDACMFSDGGPDVRWIGNEQGYAGETNWSTVKSGIFYPGVPDVTDQLQSGHEDGELWIPAEVNTSIRPGWFYHQSEDDKVKPLGRLIDNWYHSVGMNGNFLLNLPPDKRGLIHEHDAARLLELRKYLDEAFSNNLARDAVAGASNTRGGEEIFSALMAIDQNPDTYWATDDNIKQALLTIDLGKPTEVNALLIGEYIPLGQRVKSFVVKTDENVEVARGTTIGNRRIIRWKTIQTRTLTVNMTANACPTISNIEAYRVPDDL